MQKCCTWRCFGAALISEPGAVPGGGAFVCKTQTRFSTSDELIQLLVRATGSHVCRAGETLSPKQRRWPGAGVSTAVAGDMALASLWDLPALVKPGQRVFVVVVQSIAAAFPV